MSIMVQMRSQSAIASPVQSNQAGTSWLLVAIKGPDGWTHKLLAAEGRMGRYFRRIDLFAGYGCAESAPVEGSVVGAFFPSMEASWLARLCSTISKLRSMDVLVESGGCSDTVSRISFNSASDILIAFSV